MPNNSIHLSEATRHHQIASFFDLTSGTTDLVMSSLPKLHFGIKSF